MTAVYYALSCVLGYLLGSISISILISRHVFHQDVRQSGSGNAGATNMARVFGLRMGAVTLAGDMLKAAMAMLLGFALLGERGMCVAGALCLVGHCYPVLHEFRGGKGVSVGTAVFLAADWRVLAVAVVFFALAAFLSRKVSLGSITAAVALPIAALAFRVSGAMLAMCIFSAVLVIFMHRSNIARLINGTEPDFHPKKSN